MKYFIDTEFIEKPNTIDLISIGIVDENGLEYYAIHRDFNLKKAWGNEWIRENVLSPIWDEEMPDARTLPVGKGRFRGLLYSIGKTTNQIRKEILEFVDDTPKFYGYCADYDWVVFCWIFGRMIDLPKHFPMYCRDLKQMLDEQILPEGWKKKHCPDPEGEHNALVDAKWNKQLYETIVKLEQ